MMMIDDLHHDRRHIVMFRPARRFGDSSHALDGQSGYHQPEQKCLENAIHI
ncbi:hypothetical protein [Noviherbaspirillum saxi]|uniref:hypothetical protein n=1 Tax=Noviherbaspirillum saxi TaxID=2320863 RepID=UPI001314A813|nr:hypothetical protein [Noviherbaspirillum saxi]